MAPLEHQIQLTGPELNLIQTYADCRGMSPEEAALQLFSDAMAKRYLRGFHRPPATVYDIKARAVL